MGPDPCVTDPQGIHFLLPNERTRDILGKKEMNVKREERKRKEKKK
jgi:hypothetical protein